MTRFLEDILRQPEELQRAFDYLLGAVPEPQPQRARIVSDSWLHTSKKDNKREQSAVRVVGCQAGIDCRARTGVFPLTT